jgi:hypothetical protein
VRKNKEKSHPPQGMAARKIVWGFKNEIFKSCRFFLVSGQLIEYK